MRTDPQPAAPRGHTGDSWQLNPECQLRWRHWGDSSILFNAASGQTHFLNAFAFVVLDLLQQSPASAAMLCRRVAEREQIDADDEELRDGVDELLATMDELGLIEPLPGDAANP